MELRDPYGFGWFFLTPAMFLFGIVFLGRAIKTSSQRRTFFLIIAVGAVLTLGVSLLLTSAAGFPLQYSGNTQTCTPVQIQVHNSTSPSGYTNVSSENCTQFRTYYPQNILFDYIYWFPVAGLILYAMPVWQVGPALAGRVARNLSGAALAATLLLPVVGLHLTSMTYPPVYVELSPLNPYFAFSQCNSTILFQGCVSVNSVYLVIDYLFWLAIGSLIALTTSELFASFKTVVRSRSKESKERGSAPMIQGIDPSSKRTSGGKCKVN